MQNSQIEKALNNQQPEQRAALNFEFAPLAEVPDWIMLLPAGPTITGRDGRNWTNPEPQALVEVFRANQTDLPIDKEHATELKAPKGEAAPAMGWIKELAIRDGATWGRVEWNNEGGTLVGDRQYRYISPVFLYDKTTLRIMRLTSVALTNQPNLVLQALNREATKQPKEDFIMTLKELLALLGLSETATVAEATNTINKLKTDLATATNRAETPSLDKFVPRGDDDAVTLRATNAEKSLSDLSQADTEKAINTAIDAALAAGKIAPTSKDFYLASCRAEGGLSAFNKFIATAPVVAAASGLDGKEVDRHTTALNADQTKIAGMFGNSVEDLKKYGA